MIPSILNDVKDLGYKIFTQGEYNLNIIGVRKNFVQNNKFDDEIHVVFKQNKEWIDLVFPITTDPGLYYLVNPINISGTAIMVEGQYRGAYKVGLHRNKYEALVQTGGKVRVYRDRNKDEVIDMNKESIIDGYFGINIHRATSQGSSNDVNKWSAGCQVFQNSNDFDIFMSLCNKSKSIFGNSFTYTLLEK
ncbi:MAG: hypothetical protein ACR2M6_02560 [Vampirovibrionia bacterium]